MEKEMLVSQIRSLAETDPWYVALLANVSALLGEMMEDVNWTGFYLMRGGQLVLGPFQGKTACIHIPVGKGVCGAAVKEDKTIVVDDVHSFPGHIACDSASNAEIVIPIHAAGRVIGVLDIDSPLKGRFTQEDREALEAVVAALEEMPAFLQTLAAL